MRATAFRQLQRLRGCIPLLFMTEWSDYMQRLAGDDQPKVIAAKIGVDASQISRWRTGKSHPSAENAALFAHAYGSTLAEAMRASGHTEVKWVPGLPPFTTRDSPNEPPAEPAGTLVPPKDGLSDLQHSVRHTWTTAADLADAVLASGPSDALIRAAVAIGSVLSQILAARVIAANVTAEARDALLEEVYEARSQFRRRLLISADEPDGEMSGPAAGQDREDWDPGWPAPGDENPRMGRDEDGEQRDQL